MKNTLSKKLKFNKIPRNYRSRANRSVYFSLALLIAISSLIFWWPHHASATTDTFTTSGTWTVPANVSTATFEAWGGGAPGGGESSNGAGAGGGGGGQYAIKNSFSVNPGDNYTVSVATAVTGTTGSNIAGNDSSVTSPSSSTVVLAKGGTAASGPSGGVGTTSGGVGDTVYAGGSGAAGSISTATSGGGGGGAGSAGAGGNASGTTAGSGTSANGGTGGAGGTGNFVGLAGSNYGGGGSGASKSNGSAKAGGNGAPGLVTVTYTPVSYTQSNYQWFANPNNPPNTTPGAALTGSQSQAATLTSTGQAFRLRQLISPNNSIPAGTNNYDEQYAYLGSYGTCSAIPSSDYANVGTDPVTPAGPNFTGTATGNTGSGTQAWTNLSNLSAQDSAYASVFTSLSTTTNDLVATNFGFSIPSNSTINGIKVTLGGTHASVTGGINPNKFELVKAGVAQTAANRSSGSWSSTVADVSSGTSSDLWSNTWMPSDINNSGFGVDLVLDNGGGSPATAFLDSIKIIVYYTPNISIAGPSSPGTGADDTGTGSTAWTNPGNITGADSVYATNSLSLGANTDYIDASNFGFSIPSSATIKGISASVIGSGSATGLADNSVKIRKAGSNTGTEHSSGTAWTFPGNTTHTYGGSTDLWGATWTPADINASNFGLAYQGTNGSVSGTQTVSIDYVSISVYYSAPSSAGPNFVGTGTDGGGSFAWNNPGNVTASDITYATFTGNAVNPSDDLLATNLGFTIPSNAVISGVSADIVGKGSLNGQGTDSSVKIIKGGTVTGTDQSTGATWSTSPGTRTYGGSGNLWGTSLTPSDVNGANFGIAYSATTLTNGVVVSIDSITVTVYYTLPAITYMDNPTPVNGAAITYNSGADPTGNSPVGQTYNEANGFTSTSTIGGTVDGEWDLSLLDNAAPASTTYCFRTVVSGGIAFSTYSNYPQITTSSGNASPGTPTLISPASSATGVSTYPIFTLRTTDAEADYLRYRIYLYQSDCSTPVGAGTFNQDTSQAGWSGQDANSSTAYVSSTTLTSSTIATFGLLSSGQSGLVPNTTYCWKADAVDPGGSNSFGSASATQTFTTETSTRPVNIKGNINIKGNTNIR